MFEASVLSTSELFKKYDSRPDGLTASSAAQKLKEQGLNKISAHHTTALKIFLRQLTSPFIYLLFGAAILALLLGEKFDGLMILLFLLINSLIGFYQEFRSEKTLRLLNKYLLSTATVLRDGKKTRVETPLLVVGDITELQPGDIIPADMRLIESDNLTIDESVLSGESVPIIKTITAPAEVPKNIYAAKNMVFSGATVVSGSAHGLIVAIGSGTNYGQIAKISTETQRVSTFQKQLSRLSRFTLILVLSTLAFLIVANLLIKQTPSWSELILFSIALAVSVIPEALPAVTTFSLSLGALKLAKKHVVVKRLSAIEDLGSIEVLCSDKTGTLTENILTVDAIFGEREKTLLYGAIASKDATESHHISSFGNAIWAKLSEKQKTHARTSVLLETIPFDPIHKIVRTRVRLGKEELLITIGAWEQISKQTKQSEKERHEAQQWIDQQGSQGRRVLALAYATKAASKKITNTHFVGCISFIDPIKATAKLAIAQAKALGVQVKILTGDSPHVAGAVGAQVGLIDSPDAVITGDAFEARSIDEQHALVKSMHVFARVTPQQKYKILQLLQEKYETGFLGEGINDAPALKIANVALVVSNATDVSKEAADIILLKKSLHVIVEGIHEGREVFINTTKYITATLSANFGNFFAISLVSLIINYLPMLPLQILLVNLLSDFPMIAVATDTVDEESVRAPTHYDFRNFAIISILLGIISTIFDFIFFAFFGRISPTALHTAWFMGSILTELVFLFSIRTKLFFFWAKAPSKALIGFTLAAAIITIILPFTVLGQKFFSLFPLSATQLLSVAGIVILYFCATEGTKLLYYHTQIFASHRMKHRA